MTGRGLLKRIGLALAITAGFFVFVFVVVDATAMPMRPDLQKLLAEPPETATGFVPARAGWHGPEMSASVPSATRAPLEESAGTQPVRASLLAALMPDYRLLLPIGLAILLLRLVWRPAKARICAMAPREESPPAKAA